MCTFTNVSTINNIEFNFLRLILKPGNKHIFTATQILFKIPTTEHKSLKDWKACSRFFFSKLFVVFSAIFLQTNVCHLSTAASSPITFCLSLRLVPSAFLCFNFLLLFSHHITIKVESWVTLLPPLTYLYTQVSVSTCSLKIFFKTLRKWWLHNNKHSCA